ncbi:MAG: hypothetical protein KDJ69_16945 [Nitratireductor sp.]|nr:hypothetical protein [Nitratireductor sp.]
MTALNFQQQFAGDVEAGAKTQTIRAWWKDRERQQRLFAPGAKVQLYTGMRTKVCRKLGDGIVVKLFEVEIRKDGIQLTNDRGAGAWLTDSAALHAEAMADGFYNWSAMRGWFADTHGLPFSGLIICWRRV